jgi:hypothetical protein
VYFNEKGQYNRASSMRRKLHHTSLQDSTGDLDVKIKELVVLYLTPQEGFNEKAANKNTR